MKRTLAALCVAATFALLNDGCSSGSGHSSFGLGATAAATSSGSTAASTTSATYPTPAELAKRHAPIYRFNAYLPGITSVQNRDEDFFPQSVVRFFDELVAQKSRVATQLASGANPGINEIVASTDPITIDDTAIHGMPQRMSGDEPGKAPLYFHAFEDTNQQVRLADGSGEDIWYMESWYFFPKDMCLVTIATIPFPLALGGHRGDWEGCCCAIAVVLGPGGKFQKTEIRRGYFNAHYDKFRCQRSEVELVNEHPCVYVSVGKHAAYPEPGYWIDRWQIAPAAHFDEFFLGNGFEWRSETSQLIDLLDPLGSPEFSPPSFIAIKSKYADWRQFPGGWGPDSSWGPLSGSPEGPLFHGIWGSGDSGCTADWSSAKAQAVNLTLGAVAKAPAPVPIRR